MKKSEMLTELLRYFFSFLTILFFLFTQGSAIAQISVEEEGRTTEDFRPAEEQKTETSRAIVRTRFKAGH